MVRRPHVPSSPLMILNVANLGLGGYSCDKGERPAFSSVCYTYSSQRVPGVGFQIAVPLQQYMYYSHSGYNPARGLIGKGA